MGVRGSGVTRHIIWRAGMLGAAAALLMAAGPAQRAADALLARVPPGRWQLHEIGSPAPPRSICVAEAQQLMQLRHGGGACARFVIAADARAATVHYTCPGAGNGRTTLTLEEPSLLRIETQGIAGGQPFDMNLEARRTGPC